MKKSISAILATFILMGATNGPINFNGKWFHEAGTSSFELDLIQGVSNSPIIGSYCSVQQNGNFIDCAHPATARNLTGIVNDSTAIVTFKSGYCNCWGMAIIKKTDETHLAWKITQAPQGIYHIPMIDTLTKE